MEIYERVNKEIGSNYGSGDIIDFSEVSTHHYLSEEFISDFADKLDWNLISIHQKLSEELMERYIDKLDWFNVTIYQTFSEEFMERHFDEFISHYLCESHKLSEEFLERHLVSMHYCAAKYQKLSDKFIERHANYISWNDVCKFQKLSEKFMEKNRFMIDWPLICKYQHLSEDFMERNFNFLSIFDICRYQKLSDEFIERHRRVLELWLIENNWIYKSTEEKEQAVIDTELYECHDDYFIAYKAVREDGYSFYNFQYKYEKGGVYESWCDCSDNDDSFGLSVGTENFANDYGDFYVNYKIVRCKVRYEDVGRIVHDGKKIRCFKIEVLD